MSFIMRKIIWLVFIWDLRT